MQFSLNDFKPQRTDWRDIFGKGHLPVVPEITLRGCLLHLCVCKASLANNSKHYYYFQQINNTASGSKGSAPIS